ncbi:MAG TPA: hypothetical protein VKY89_13695 [Thermoanaerobaculia bacterium]|nr:hypothetical protein [Thermoanaerobaculia bacterium]
MLRITTQHKPEEFRFRLEGKVSGPWVDELERSWYAVTQAVRGGHVLVDLSEVTFIDAEGKKLLAWMHEQGAEFLCAGCMTRGIVDEIKRERAEREAGFGSGGTV